MAVHPAYLKDFLDHPFTVNRETQDYKDLFESIKTYGISEPVLCRPGRNGGLEIISGHRRHDIGAQLNYPILFAAIRDTKEDDGVVALVTNTDFVSPVNLFMQRRGYPAPTQTQEDDTVKKDAPRTQQGNSSPERGNGSTVSRMSQTTRTTDTAEKISDIPTVKGRLAVLQKTAAGMRDGQAKQRSQPTQQKSR